ncbi:hypothetical protein Dimus_011094 [Dionaea muscipula]
MKATRACILLLLLLLSIIAATLLDHSYARKHPKSPIIDDTVSESGILKTKDEASLMELESASSNYSGSPFTLPPYDSLPPFSLPEDSPPHCVCTPSTTPLPPVIGVPTPSQGTPPELPSPPLSPTGTLPSSPPSPTGTLPSPPEPITAPGPPQSHEPSPILSPPFGIPMPPESVPSPPYYEPSQPPGYIPTPSPIGFMPSPPLIGSGPSPPSIGFEPSPPIGFMPSPPSIGFEPSPPTGFMPSPPVFQPPVVFPSPVVPPPPLSSEEGGSLWCVAKPSVPDPMIQEAMNYACASGADCSLIQAGGSCYEPNSLFTHASYAFNSYWQRTKVAGGTCDFGGTAMLVTVDPSYDGCHFIYA